MTKKDRENLQSLIHALKSSNDEQIKTVDHKKIKENTGSLYRFGYFVINGYEYCVVNWSFRNKTVVFELQSKNPFNVKFDTNSRTVVSGLFKQDGKIKTIVKKIRNYLSRKLKDYSEQLQT